MAIGVMLTSFYNVVDNFFAGMFSVEGLAVLSLATIVLFLLIVLSIATNAAIVALVGKSLGARRMAEAKRLACQGLSSSVIFSVTAAAVFWMGSPWLVEAIATPGELQEKTVDYLNLAILSTPAFIVSFSANAILATQGQAVPMLRAQLASAIANCGLNPLFMFGIPGLFSGFGISGIAISTLVCQTGVMIYVVRQALKSELMSQGERATYRPIREDFASIVRLTLPISAGYVLIVVGIFVVQVYLKRFGVEAIAAFGVGLRIQQVLLMTGLAIAAALRAIAAQNVGAGKHARVREALRYCLKAGGFLMFVAALALWLAGRPLMALFSDDPEVVRIGVEFLKVYGLLLPVHLFTFSLNSLLQVFQRPAVAFGITLFRELFGVAGFVALFVVAWEMKTLGIWLGVAASVVTAGLLTLIVTTIIARKQIGGLFQNQGD